MPPAEWILPSLGGLLVAAAVVDMFLTVLHPGSDSGAVSRALSRVVVGLWRAVGRRLSGERRKRFLTYTGPVLLAVTLTVWFVLLAVGWALVYKDALGTGVRAASGPTDTGWATALYVSSFNLTTLGVGDIVPVTPLYRLMTAFQAVVGFAFFGMATTYALSVYSTLASRNAALQAIHDMTGRTGDAVELLVRLLSHTDTTAALQRLGERADELRRVEQMIRLYPVLAHFHLHAPAHALPVSLDVMLDSVSLIVTTFDPRRHPALLHSSLLDDVWTVSLSLAHALLSDGRAPSPSAEEAQDWRARHALSRRRLQHCGLALVPDEEAAAGRYVALRAQWNALVERIGEDMLYEWHSAAQSDPGLPALRGDGRGPM